MGAYVGNATAENAELVDYLAATEIVAWVCFADVRSHWAFEVCFVRACGIEVEVVGARGVGGDVFVVEFGGELDGAAYSYGVSDDVHWEKQSREGE